MDKKLVTFKNKKFLFHFDIRKESICSECGSKAPGQHKLYVEGDSYEAAEYLIDNLDKVKLHIISEELKKSKLVDLPWNKK